MCLILVGFAAPASAVTDEEIYSDLRFAPVLPGARAAAMGSAGVALVEDATASTVNASRLPSLLYPQIYLELESIDSGSGGDINGVFQPAPQVNPFAGTSFSATSEPEDDITGLVSYAHPLKGNKPLVLGVTLERSTFVSRAESMSRTTPVSAPITPVGGDEVVRSSRGRMDAELTEISFAAGYGMTPNFWFGGSLVLGRLDVDAFTGGSLADPLQFTGPGMVDPRFSGSEPAPLLETTTDDSSTAIAIDFGVFYRARPGFSLSAIFRGGPEFELDATHRNLLTGVNDRFTNTIKIPDRATLGFAWTPWLNSRSPRIQSVTVVFDLDYVEYSDLEENFRGGINIQTNSAAVAEATYEADDELELHLGLEYVESFQTWSLAIRGGAYTDHQGSLQLTGITDQPGALQGSGEALIESGFFEEQETETHFTLGFGASFYRLGIDMSADFGEPGTRVLLAVTYSLRD